MFQGLGVHFDAGDVHRVLALCDRAEGHLRQAETRLMQARELARQTGSRLTEAEVLRELGRLYGETGRKAEGMALLREAARVFAGLGARGEAGTTESEAALLR
jgi:tetratricopeptide (TPR) repeat protein